MGKIRRTADQVKHSHQLVNCFDTLFIKISVGHHAQVIACILQKLQQCQHQHRGMPQATGQIHMYGYILIRSVCLLQYIKHDVNAVKRAFYC